MSNRQDKQDVVQVIFLVTVILLAIQQVSFIFYIHQQNFEINLSPVLSPLKNMSPQTPSEPPTLSNLFTWERGEIVNLLGPIYEHSPWIAETLYDDRLSDLKSYSLKTIRELFDEMKQIVESSTQEQKLTLLRAHPDLCERVSNLKTLTDASQEEQSRAGLQYMTETERDVFLSTNEMYKKKFGFPFILAVRNASKYTVLSAIKARVNNSKENEFSTALGEVHKIAWMRLLGKIDVTNPKGFLTCHVLDTATGSPAANMRIHLKRVSPIEDADFIAEFITNEDGRLSGGPALKGESFKVGVYEWTFFVGDYFASKNVQTAGTPFLSEVPIRFGIDDPDEHYHVPLLVSPWSFSTYRGS